MAEDTIYDFQGLKDFLTRRGYTIRERDTYIEIDQGDVTKGDIQDGTITFNDEGIFVKDKKNVFRQVFLFKGDYHLQEFGKPRFHICKCKTINEFINGGLFKDHYRYSNSEPVTVIDLDNDNVEEEVEELPLCQNCRKVISEYGKINSTDFVNQLKEKYGLNNDNTNNIEVDIFGYTRDWEQISKQYREEHQYTCENCGLKIDDVYERQYIHVHHIDGDKTNNQEENLKCLCLFCHAHIDEHHKQRLTTGANGIIYEKFKRKYKS